MLLSEERTLTKSLVISQYRKILFRHFVFVNVQSTAVLRNTV